MFRSRRASRIVLAVLSAAAALAALAIALLPSASASADTCTVSLELLGGQVISFTVDVPPGTGTSQIALPLHLGSVNESCAPSPAPPAPTPAPAAPKGPAAPAPTVPSSSSSLSPLRTLGGGAPGRRHGRLRAGQNRSRGGATPLHSAGTGSAFALPAPATRTPSSPPPAPKPGLTALRGTGGVPAPSNPTFSFALPGPAPLGVPNFFIDSFRIPPFLLPIYQAAGIEYDVPWQVLAAINEIESDYGRNLSISSAGAVGWMQFLPATFKQYGVDATGTGLADPYNPVDAIFTAARYLSAAGAAKNLPRAIFAYNHASWYVQSVLLRAKLIGGLPDQLLGALTGLVEGHFPVAARAKYADDSVERLATRRVKGANAAIPIDSNPGTKGVSIFARQGAPVIAVNDGKVVKVGQNATLGHYLELQDQTGNIYTYAQLGSIPKQYPVPKPVKITAADIAKELSVPKVAKPSAPASAGAQTPSATPTAKQAAKTVSKSAKGASVTLPSTAAPRAAAAPPAASPPAVVKERLFAYPSRPASYAAGGQLQLQDTTAQISNFHNYFSDVLHLGKNQYTLKPLKAGAIVVAGTILGRLGGPSRTTASHLLFMVQAAGKGAPKIDPKPILDGWKLLQATAVYRANGVDPFYGPGAKNATVGQVLLESKEQLTNRILVDPHVHVYTCGRRDIQAGLIDRRVLAAIEFLSASGLDPTISGLQCGHSLTGSTGTDAAGATGSSVDISKINGIPILGHQGSGSIADITIRRLLTLQGGLKPDQIVSLMTFKGQSNTLALPDHTNRVQVVFTPLYGQNKKLSREIKAILKPGQWVQLISRISQIPEPTVPTAPSKYAIRVAHH